MIKRLLQKGDRVCVVLDGTEAELSMKMSNLVSFKSHCHECGAASKASLMNCPKCWLISFCGPICFSKNRAGHPGHTEECNANYTEESEPTEEQLKIERSFNGAVLAEEWSKAKAMERQATVVDRALQNSSPDLAAIMYRNLAATAVNTKTNLKFGAELTASQKRTSEKLMEYSEAGDLQEVIAMESKALQLADALKGLWPWSNTACDIYQILGNAFCQIGASAS